jgi:hypothetical protein
MVAALSLNLRQAEQIYSFPENLYTEVLIKAALVPPLFFLEGKCCGVISLGDPAPCASAVQCATRPIAPALGPEIRFSLLSFRRMSKHTHGAF